MVEQSFVADLLGEGFAFLRAVDGVDVGDGVVVLQIFNVHFLNVILSFLALVFVHVFVVDKVLRFGRVEQEFQELLVLGALFVQKFDLVVERVVFGVWRIKNKIDKYCSIRTKKNYVPMSSSNKTFPCSPLLTLTMSLMSCKSSSFSLYIS